MKALLPAFVSLFVILPTAVLAADPVYPGERPGVLVDSVVRGQSPAAAGVPIYDPAPTLAYNAPVGWGTLPVMPVVQIAPAPGAQQAPWAAPSPGQASAGLTFGAHAGLQPYRLNAWTGRVESAFLPKESTSTGLGKFAATELDVELEFSSPFTPGWIFSFTQLFDMRWWEGPSDPGDTGPPPVPGNGLPARAYRIGWDLELATVTQGSYSAQLAFTPSLATDFDSGIDSDAWQFDGRGVLYFQYPGMTIALGAGYWDRVRDRVIPYAGIIFKPDSIWEWQLMFPQSKVSVFLGNFGGNSSWMYTKAEYNVESYQLMIQRTHGAAAVADQIELKDYRVMLGFRSEAMQYSSFIEAGWIFRRDVRFAGTTPGFSIGDGFIGRIGISF